MYIQYVRTHRNTLIVFDGYENGPSTKDEDHERRMCGLVGADVDLSLDMRMNKRLFLANLKNNQRFIKLLGYQIQHMDGITVKHSQGDADYDIVKFDSSLLLFNR